MDASNSLDSYLDCAEGSLGSYDHKREPDGSLFLTSLYLQRIRASDPWGKHLHILDLCFDARRARGRGYKVDNGVGSLRRDLSSVE